MQRVTYRKTLDVTSGGVQFLLQGFETADRVSRRIDISLMSDGDTYDIPSGNVTALMYVRQPDSETTEMYECEIKNNRIIYDARPITNEGIALMQLELVRTDAHNNVSVLVAPKFEVEVLKSEIDGTAIENEVGVSIIEDAIGKAKRAHDRMLKSIEIDQDCIFRAYFEDGDDYETDLLRRLFLNGEAELSKSYAEGDTGIRVGENADNAKHYSDVAKSESEKAKKMLAESEEVLADIRLQGTQTFFTVNFETGEVEYISPSYEFAINEETGELDADRQTQKYDDVIDYEVKQWLTNKGLDIDKMNKQVASNTMNITDVSNYTSELDGRMTKVETEARPISLGGTGATTAEGAIANFGLRRVNPGDYYELISTHDVNDKVEVYDKYSKSFGLGLEEKINNYDEIVIVVDGTYSLGAPGNFHNGINKLLMGLSYKTTTIEHKMFIVSQSSSNNGSGEISNGEIDGLIQRFFATKIQNVSAATEIITTYNLQPLNGDAFSADNLYFNVSFENNNGGTTSYQPIALEFNLTVRVYGRSCIFKTKNQEE